MSEVKGERAWFGQGLETRWEHQVSSSFCCVCAAFLHAFLDDTPLFFLFPLSPHSFLSLSDAPKNEGDGGGRETEREDRRGRRTAGQSVGVWQAAHTQCMCLASHTQREDKTRHGNGDTHMGMDDMTHTRGKGREKTRGGTREDTQALLFSKMKKKEKRQ